MKITISPKFLRGQIAVPPSKSYAHRLILAAALASGESRLKGLGTSQDILATLSCIRALGAREENGRILGVFSQKVGSPPSLGESRIFECRESGATLRFLIPVSLALTGGGVFVGSGRLMERPQTPYARLFYEKGISFSQKQNAITVSGRLTPGLYEISGGVSSQFITGLLYALPLLDGDSEVRLTSKLESASYVDMAVDVLSRRGIWIREERGSFFVKGNQRFLSRDSEVEGDYSQAAFYDVANALGSSIDVSGLNPHSKQGDRVMRAHIKRLSERGEATLDVSQCPDLAPPLAACAALRAGETTVLSNAGRLRLKESDRLSTITTQLNRLGAAVSQGRDFLSIRGVSELRGGTVDSCNDHRIAMMLAIAAIRARNPVTIWGAECVGKSYPEFWSDYERLGGTLSYA